jgi:hypothetical protein
MESNHFKEPKTQNNKVSLRNIIIKLKYQTLRDILRIEQV